MNSLDIATEFRSEMRDEQSPYLWSDNDVLRYMNEAIRQICLKAWGLADEMTVTFPANSQTPVLVSKRVLRFNAAFGPDGRRLEFRSVAESPDMYLRSAGKLCALVQDVEEHKLVPYPAPNTDTDVRFQVYRLPLEDLKAINVFEEIELSDESRIGIVHYMRHLAFLKTDAETYDRGKADDFLGLFDRFADEYRRERERRYHHTRVTPTSGGYWP